MVVALHLGGIKLIGIYAVFGFYILSGYLMTLIMHKSYGYSINGIIKFTFNRFLRIYPLYWLSCLISLLLILWVGKNYAFNYHEALCLPQNITSAIKNIFILLSTQETPRLTPPAWALTVEIFYYMVIALGLSKNKTLTIGWFLFSVLYHLLINFKGLGLNYQYFIIPAASLPFAIGGLTYFYQNKLISILESLKYFEYFISPITLMILFIFNWLLGLNFEIFGNFSFYTNCLIHALIIISLLNIDSLPYISKKTDKWIGSFSYPVYLIHYQIGLFILVIFDNLGIGYQRPSIALMFASILPILIVSWLLNTYIKNPIETIRRQVKANQKLGQA
ncbi:acyltransferase [Waterburya agarophytonicola K14]|uniref:Acyltransferase n=2 Tax=Waterburya TaxID=2886915 RepID=A0A964BQE3_9CYAN|nr:acyltransferase [Waterburya agarophytonicola KI4]